MFQISASALAGGSTGGGNTVNRRLVEEYAIDDPRASLPDFQSLDRYLKVFSDRIPGCGETLRDIASAPANSGVTWYALPRKIRALPSSVTGLRFSTDQAAVQVEREIFLSSVELGKLSPETRELLYLHEVLMMAHPSKDAGSVRRLMAFLKKTRYAPPELELQKMLGDLGFESCAQPTKSGLAAQDRREKAVAQIMAEIHGRAYAQFLHTIAEACAGPNAKESLRNALIELNTKASLTLKDLSPAQREKIAAPSHGFLHESLEGDEIDETFHRVNVQFKERLVTNAHFASLMAATDPITMPFKIDGLSPDATDLFTGYAQKYLPWTEAQETARACSDASALQRKRNLPDDAENRVPGESEDAR